MAKVVKSHLDFENTAKIQNLPDPSSAQDAATKNYVDTGLSGKVSKSGDTMTGYLTLSGDPTNALHAATKQYVDNGLSGKVSKSGDTMTGYLTLVGDPTSALHAATKQYVDNGLNTKVSKSGDTMTGYLTLVGDPTNSLHAATKQYVDNQVSSAQPKRYATTFGNANDTDYTITHNLNTKDLLCTIRQTSDDREVIAEVDYESNNTIVVRLAAAPGNNALRIVIIG